MMHSLTLGCDTLIKPLNELSTVTIQYNALVLDIKAISMLLAKYLVLFLKIN